MESESFRMDTSLLEVGVSVCSCTWCVGGILLFVVGTKAATGDDVEIVDDDRVQGTL